MCSIYTFPSVTDRFKLKRGWWVWVIQTLNRVALVEELACQRDIKISKPAALDVQLKTLSFMCDMALS